MKTKFSSWTMHEFFAGSGLVAYSLSGMFRPVWSNDISEKKARIYKENLGSDHFVLDDIGNIHGQSMPMAHLSWASFPCQDLSLAGSVGGIHASRSGLVWQWLRILDEMYQKPKILILENVLGLISTHSGENYCVLHHALVERGYVCGPVVINSDRFLPQSRPRVFVIAVKNACKIPPDLIIETPCWLQNKAVMSLNQKLGDVVFWHAPAPPEMGLTIEDIIDKSVDYDRDDVLRLIPEKHLHILNEATSMYATGYRRTRNGKQRLEVRFDGIAGCLRTPEGGSSKQYLIAKENGRLHARLLTVCEYARLMGVPDSFKLPGSPNDGYFAMGDAVVVPVVRYIGRFLLTKLAEAVYGDELH